MGMRARMWTGAGVLGLLSAASLQGCSADGSHESVVSDGRRAVGEVGLALQLPDGSTVNDPSYTITRASDPTYLVTGTLTVQGSTATGTVNGLPVGSDYLVTLSATRSLPAGAPPCTGSATFVVTANTTTNVSVVLECDDTSGPTGNITINGSYNICPKISSSSFTPNSASVGSAIALTVTATDKDGDAISYAWSASDGTFSPTNAASTSYTCGSAGTKTLNLSITDGPLRGCTKQAAPITVTCTPSFDGGAGTDGGVHTDGGVGTDGGPGTDGGTGAPTLAALEHLVVIYLENHSFDNLYGTYPGAEGLAAANVSGHLTQIDFSTGMPFATLPQTDPNVPMTLPNAPFDITSYVPGNQKTVDLVHRFYQEQLQIDAGKMDGFVSISDAKGLSMGYYPTNQLPMWNKIASIKSQVTMCDQFFHSAFGGSFLNHHWLIAAASPTFPGAPTSIKAVLDASGKLVTDGAVTPDGFVVNTSYSVNTPHPATANPANLVPSQTNPTIGDRLNDKGVDWAWYAGGWSNALAGTPDPLFQFHHQPFVYYANYADGTALKAAHLKDETAFIASATAGTLPAVSFVKPLGTNNEHPGYTDLFTGEQHLVSLVTTVMSSPTWSSTAIIITYDEHGGFWDHVSPPVVDRWGPGSRVPGIVISPFAKGGVDSTPYDTSAILKLIEERWGTQPLTARVTSQPSLASHALNFAP